MAAVKLALALVAMIALIAGSGVRANPHSRSLRLLYDVPACETTVEEYIALNDFNRIAGSGATANFQLVLGPGSAGVTGRCANTICIALGKSLATTPDGLQLANLEANNIKAISSQLAFPNIHSAGAYINTAPGYETPREGVGIKPTSGPIGRNNLVLTSTPPTGTTFTIDPPSAPAGSFVPGNGAASLAVICGPPRDQQVPPATFCTIADPEFQGWAITTASFASGAITCPQGRALGNAEANNLFKSSPTLPNPKNLFDGTGFPLLQTLIAACAPGERVWVNTAPHFTSGKADGSPQGLPPYCVTISQGAFGDAKGVDPKKTGGKVDPTNPLCLETHKALCFGS